MPDREACFCRRYLGAKHQATGPAMPAQQSLARESIKIVVMTALVDGRAIARRG
jgi:hypothetical protein